MHTAGKESYARQQRPPETWWKELTQAFLTGCLTRAEIVMHAGMWACQKTFVPGGCFTATILNILCNIRHPKHAMALEGSVVLELALCQYFGGVSKSHNVVFG